MDTNKQSSATLHYIVGDATAPITAGPKIIAHICNDIGGWGAGFVLAITKRWKLPEQQYREWSREPSSFRLGQVRLVQVEHDTYVANMIAQHGVRGPANPVPLNIAALLACLVELRNAALLRAASVHMPRIGCGLAGGDWNRIEPLIQIELTTKGVGVFVYDLPK